MNTAHILLVDDDLALLQALPHAISLRMTGVQIQTAADASTALSLLQEQEYDAIVSDIKMPGMDGLELLARIAERHPDTPVLLITGHGEHELAIQAIRGGAYDYILKPIDRDDFVASLQRALHTRQLRRQIEVQQRALEWYALSLEQQVEQRTRELVTTNTTKDALLHMVAHELASPLTSLKGHVQMIDRQLQRADEVEKIRRTVSEVVRSMSRWERVVQDLQDTAHIQTLRFVLHRSRCDLVEICRQVLTEFTAGVGTAPTCEFVAESLEADVDPERISQVLLNLLFNARKYSPKGAPITILIRQAGEEAIIAIRDQGVGIPTEQISRLTEPFYRVPGIEVQTGSTTGLGLGLYLVRTIVEQHGGRLEVLSREGKGSTFSVVLPLIV
ncbi:MAG TPA: HAMP domain-containing sensor histidine kinase [Ktedonobacteraceae bacterium]|nr:HAMP domain-containing sensor histidine kinase [Ktedonobacteraceae bacterium]